MGELSFPPLPRLHKRVPIESRRNYNGIGSVDPGLQRYGCLDIVGNVRQQRRVQPDDIQNSMYFGWDAEGALTGIAQIESRISQLRGEVKDKVRAQVKSVYDLLEEGSGPAAATKVKMLLTNSAFTFKDPGQVGLELILMRRRQPFSFSAHSRI
jgi:hypothetical protein